MTFARDWIAAWNDRDVEAALSHFHPDAEFSSPLAARLGYGAAGVLAGKEAIREYWTAALALNPGLHFDLTEVFAGIDVIVIGFRTQGGDLRAEVLRFRGGLVVAGHGTFLEAP